MNAIARSTTDPLLDEAGALRTDPRFGAAVAAYATGLVRYRESIRRFGKLSANELRMRAIGYLMHLSAAGRLAGGDGGVSYGSLYRLCVEGGEVNPRVFKTMLALLGVAGFVRSWRDPADRRIKFYRPTARMTDYARRALLPAAAALDCLAPAADRARRLVTDDLYFARLLVSAGRGHAESPPADRMPEFIGYFGRREGAGPVVTRLIEARHGGSPIPSRAALARQFGLSRTQVAEVVAEGMRLGYIASGADGLPVTTPRLEDHFGRWVSIELAFLARHMQP